MNVIIKRAATTVLAVCLVFSGVMYAYAAEPRFPDMSGHWAEKYVDELADKGVISGMEDGLFHPDLPVTTSQFVTMILVSRYGKIDPISEYWASGYLDYASKLGIIYDYDIDSAEELLIRRSAARIGHETLLKELNEDDESDWSNAERLADLYTCKTCVMHIAQFYTKGIMIGRPDGLFHIDDNLTRAEAAIVVMKMFDPSLRNPQRSAAPLPEVSKNGAITPNEANRILESDKTAILVDVRSQEEHNAEYIPGSVCVPLPEIIDDLSGNMPPNKDLVIIVYCQKGSRSQKAFDILKEAGYTNVYNLGGIEDWPYEIISEDK